MLIKQDSVKNHSDNFYNFSQEISSYGIVSFEVRSFAFEELDKKDFSIADVKRIFYDPSKPMHADSRAEAFMNSNSIDGVIEKADFDECMNNIAMRISLDHFSWADADEDCKNTFEGYKLVSDEEMDRRYNWFFGQIQKYFSGDVTRTYELYPATNSYLDGAIFWGFCYIFIDDTSNTGIVIVGQSYD